MRHAAIALAVLAIGAGCSKKHANDGNTSATAEPASGSRQAATTTAAAPVYPPEVAELFGVLLDSGASAFKDVEDENEIARRKKTRRPPPLPLEWPIKLPTILTNYYLLEPATAPITWRGITIGYRKREVLLDGTIIESWYVDKALTKPLQDVRIVTTPKVSPNGDREITVVSFNRAFQSKFVIKIPKDGNPSLTGTSTAGNETTSVSVVPNPAGAQAPFHVKYSDNKGLSGEKDVSPRGGRRPTPLPAPAPSAPPPAPAPVTDNSEAERRAAAEQQRKVVEAAQRTVEQLDQARKQQEMLRQVEEMRRAAEQARQAQEMAEAARKAAEMADAARRAVEQAEAARRAAEQAEAARRAAEAARQPPVIIIPH